VKKDKLTFWVIVSLLTFWVLARIACAYDTVQITTCEYIASTNNRTYIVDSLGCNDVAIHFRCSDCSLRVQGGGRGKIVYGIDGGSTSGEGGGDNFDNRWNIGGTGIMIDPISLGNNIVIKGLSVISGVTDTGWGTDSANSGMSAIVGTQTGYTNIEMESLIIKIWTANSQGIYMYEPGNPYFHDITIYDSVRQVGHHDHLRGSALFIEKPPTGTNDSSIARRVRIIGFPLIGIGLGKTNQTATRYTKIEGCYVDGGDYWGTAGKWKNSYGIGAANINRYDTLRGTQRGFSLQWGDADRRDVLVESCDVNIHGRAERCNAPLSGCAPNPGINWCFKMQTYGGAAAKGIIRHNNITVRCDSVSGQGAYGNITAFSIDGFGVWAEIYGNTIYAWSFRDSTNTGPTDNGGVPGSYGYYAACIAMNEGENNKNDSIKIWDNTFKTNNRATSFGWHLDGAIDSADVGVSPCSSNTFQRTDTLQYGGTYSPKFRTAYVSGGCQGIRIVDAIYSGGASADSIYVQSGGSLSFINNVCGSGSKGSKVRVKR